LLSNASADALIQDDAKSFKDGKVRERATHDDDDWRHVRNQQQSGRGRQDRRRPPDVKSRNWCMKTSRETNAAATSPRYQWSTTTRRAQQGTDVPRN